MDTDKFLQQVDRYLEFRGWKETTLGQHVNGDRKLIGRIRQGKGRVFSDTLDKVRAYMRLHPARKAKKRKSV